MTDRLEINISVVVACTVQTAAWLPETLKSVLAQSSPSHDIIVVENGAVPELPPMSARQARRLRLLHRPRGSRAELRNAGLAAARGALVAFCDSGDLWKPSYLAIMREMWRVEGRLLLAYGDAVPLRGNAWGAERSFANAPAGFWDGQRSLGPLLSVFDRPPMLRLLDFQPFLPSGLVADRGFLEAAGGWDTACGQRPGNDFATTMRLARHAPFGIMHQAMVGVRPEAEGPAHAQAVNMGEAAVLQDALAHDERLWPQAAAIRAAIIRRRQAALDIAFARGDFAALQEIAALLPRRERLSPTRLKLGLAALPAPLRRAGSAALFGLASSRLPARWPGN
ncbi:glycosyltransferase family A protein [Pseudoroseomonas ludipueritiae]|uniref:Glycosyltransferase family 2 protein n=1 Tax=Pseudoroseomonas ludipueritiae TaxID=198093 RepID=A0ABR7RDY3_9PROT|nr:glycosyltransferase family A protein [Pseudoroseomonas ludipueritiae]MBC9179968.1 glycosyltransferase family 2 protein [Pseudoroseomonas ludipueritiae]